MQTERATAKLTVLTMAILVDVRISQGVLPKGMPKINYTTQLDQFMREIL